MHDNVAPLAAKLRPSSLDEFVGQKHLTSAGKPLRLAYEHGRLHSMILWGPPGVGKTTLAKLLTESAKANFIAISAVLAGVKEIREAIAAAQQSEQATILFIDEIHRFNKSQQDALLPFVENGTVTLIGATTENPSFELNNALLSRARVYVLKSLTQEDLLQVIARGIDTLQIEFPEDLRLQLVLSADGDARRALNLLELTAEIARSQDQDKVISEAVLQTVLTESYRRFDNKGDLFYEQISAFIKSVRGSSPDAALYWLARMLDAGCDPFYIARRIVRLAAEDIGNADPRALEIALNAWDMLLRLGSPEGEVGLAQAATYLACCAKSNAVYLAFGEAMQDAKLNGSLDVPLHLRNAPTALMKKLDYAKDYRYAHDEAGGYAAGVNYFPEGMPEKTYYRPVDRGLESKIAEKLKYLRGLSKNQA